MEQDKSYFYKYGILPEVCIHTRIEDEYSKHFTPRQTCECGCNEWIDGELKVFEDIGYYRYPMKQVHRCKECNAVRLSDKLE